MLFIAFLLKKLWPNHRRLYINMRNFSLQTWMKIEVMHRAKCWNVHQVPKWPIRDRLNRLHDFGCKTMQIRSSGSPMRWRPQQSSLQPALHRTTSLVEAPYELYNHSCHMHQTKFHIIQIKGKKFRSRAARLRGLSSTTESWYIMWLNKIQLTIVT